MKRLLLAATLLGAPLTAAAQTVTGPYIGLGGGANFMQQQRPSNVSTGGFVAGGPAVNLSYDTGFVGVGALGYGLGNGLRFELEGSYRYNRLDGRKTASLISDGGREEKYGAMVNAVYDFDIGAPVVPYAGVGVGYQWTHFQQRTTNVDAFGPIFTSRGGTQGSFAYQAMLGAAFPITAVPGLSLTAEYRFMGLAESRTHGGPIFAPATASTPAAAGRSTFRFRDGDDYNHGLMVGLRYAFNAAPPPVIAPGPGPGADGRPHLPRVLRLGPRRPHRPRPADHRRGRTGHDAGAGHPDRGLGPHGHLRHGQLQPGPVGPPRAERGGGAGAPGRAARRDQHAGLRVQPAAGRDGPGRA